MTLTVTYGGGLAAMTAINPLDSTYGCVGDGVTDDTTRFQAAVTAAQGGALYVPPGHTFLVGDIVVLGQTTILGGSGAISSSPHAASILKAKGGTTRILDARDKFQVTVEGVYLNGNGIASYGADLSNSTIGGANQHRVTDCSVTGTSVAGYMMDQAGESYLRGNRSDLLTSGYAVQWQNQGGNSYFQGGSYFGGPILVDGQVVDMKDVACVGLYITKVSEQVKVRGGYIYQRINLGGAGHCVEIIASPVTPGATGANIVSFDNTRFVLNSGNAGKSSSGNIVAGVLAQKLAFNDCKFDWAGSASTPNFFGTVTSARGAGDLLVEVNGGYTSGITWNPSATEYEVRTAGFLDGIANVMRSEWGTRMVEMPEMTDYAAPSANRSRLYTRDNGSGKTQLVVRFPTGAIQVIATEP